MQSLFRILIVGLAIFGANAPAKAFSNHLAQTHLGAKELQLVSSFPGAKDSQSFQDSTQQLFTEFKQRLILQEKNMDPRLCQESLNAKIGIDFSASADFKNFLKDMVNVEGFRCLENKKSKSIAQLVQILLNDQFQMQAFDSLIKSQTSRDNLRSCQQTSVLFIGHSSYCYNTWIEQDENSALILSVVDQSNHQLSAPIYLRWAAILLRKMNDGRFKMYSLAFGRGPTIPLKFIAEKIMESKEDLYSKALKQWML